MLNKQGVLDTLQHAVNAVKDARPDAALYHLKETKALVEGGVPKGSIAITVTMKKDDVPALLVAIFNHAHSLRISAVEAARSMKELKNSATFDKDALRQAEEDYRTWTYKAEVLEEVKKAIKRQARIK